MNRYALILFDLDGTLVETAPEIADAVNDTLSELGLSAVTQSQVNDWIGHGTLELLIQALAYVQAIDDQLVRTAPTLQAQAAVFKKHYRARCGTRSHCYPHVKDALAHLKAQGVRLGVVTNKESAYTQTVLDAHGLTPLFDCVISGDTLPMKKPKPDGVFACMAQFGVQVDQVLFIGDSSIDVATARAAGVAVWAVPYGYNMGQAIADSKPDRLIQDFSAFLT
jgi:phosphoglycolate phosphatase